MPYIGSFSTMPKESRRADIDTMSCKAPYERSASSTGYRQAAIWSTSDDEILLQARASGLNWQPIASRHFPSKTANACRKRHERLIERRQAEDWDTVKLELLAREYMACRKEMWDILASRLGERWAVVEAKCMEKGLKTLQTAARTAERKATADSQSLDDRGISEHNSDSGIGLSPDTEFEVGDQIGPLSPTSSVHAHTWFQQQQHQLDQTRARSLPQPLPLYQPPPPVTSRRHYEGARDSISPEARLFQERAPYQRDSPESRSRRPSYPHEILQNV